MASWTDLIQELDRWRAEGRQPTLWWRDDDVDAPSAALDRLLALADRHAAALHLAVIPAQIDPGLAPVLTGHKRVHVLQHGFAHHNHEPRGTGASEIGQYRDPAVAMSDLATGWARLQDAALPRVMPVLAPPWNRIAASLVPHLPSLGYRGLSTVNARPSAMPVPGLVQVNIHYDPIRWKGGAHFRGDEGTLKSLVGHLRDRRTGVSDADEPTGLNTHCLQSCEAVWTFLDRLLSTVSTHGQARWVSLEEALTVGATS